MPVDPPYGRELTGEAGSGTAGPAQGKRYRRCFCSFISLAGYCRSAASLTRTESAQGRLPRAGGAAGRYATHGSPRRASARRGSGGPGRLPGPGASRGSAAVPPVKFARTWPIALSDREIDVS